MCFKKYQERVGLVCNSLKSHNDNFLKTLKCAPLPLNQNYQQFFFVIEYFNKQISPKSILKASLFTSQITIYIIYKIYSGELQKYIYLLRVIESFFKR